MSAYQLDGQASLRTFFQQLDNSFIRQNLGLDIYHKGMVYYRRRAVDELEAKDAHNVKALVIGSGDYKVKITSETGKVTAKCNCHYGSEWGGMCKHIAAVLIKAVEEKFWQEIPEPEEPAEKQTAAGSQPRPAAPDVFETWLASLSEEDLRQTVRKLASAAFREEITIRHGSQDKRELVFLDTKKKISKAIGKLGNYDGGEAFEEKIFPLLEKLRGVWTEHPAEVKDIFLEIIAAVNEAQDDSSMFDEYSEESYDGSELAGFLIDFLNELPDSLRLSYLPELWQAASEDGYTSFEAFFSMASEYLKPPDWQVLKNDLADYEWMDTDFSKTLYEALQPAMTIPEKEEWLETLASQSDNCIVMLALFYEKEKGDLKKAAKTLDKALDRWLKQPKEAWWRPSEAAKQVLDERIRLAKAANEPLEPLAERSVSLVPTAESLQRALELAPNRKKTLEGVLREKSISQYLVHIESEQRLDEIVQIIEANKKGFAYSAAFGYSGGFSRYEFYARHKEELPEKALTCFRERLVEQLPNTGDNYYREVTDALKNMQPLLSPEAFRRELSNIRLTYQRRRNLMTMLDAAFGKK